MTVSTSGGQMMRSARKERNVSQRHLADSVGVNFTYISKIENGAMPPPSDATISAIATTLELDSDDLFVGFGKIPPDIIAALKGDAELTRRVRLLMNSEPTAPSPGRGPRGERR